MTFTFLVKSIKYGGFCLCFYDNEKKRWIRPIWPGGFTDKDLLMDNGEPMSIFDVVDLKLGKPTPIKHHIENYEFPKGSDIKFVKKLGDEEKNEFLDGICDTAIIEGIESKYDLYEAILASKRSITMIGPIKEFGIGYGKHPSIWFTREGNTIFSLPCTDFEFCKFAVKVFETSGGKQYVNSAEIAEFREKQVFFVIGLTGDSVKENGELKDGKYTPDEKTIPARYWPMVVSIITVPNYY
jgi:hypothetical protein